MVNPPTRRITEINFSLFRYLLLLIFFCDNRNSEYILGFFKMLFWVIKFDVKFLMLKDTSIFDLSDLVIKHLSAHQTGFLLHQLLQGLSTM
jgi:hypothetical protein